MNRLIQAGLMFANLTRVDTPALVERYNRALHHLTGKRTALTEFAIDISGYSPRWRTIWAIRSTSTATG